MGKKVITRKKFLATLSAGAGTIIIGNSLNAVMPVGEAKKTDPFRKITLGNTGIKTTLLGMGTGFSGYNRSSNITRAGVAESVIKSAWEKGICYFDCADSYGTHPFTAAALKGVPREKYVIGTKMWVTSGGIPEKERPDAQIVIDRFRKELNTDYIDLVQLHCMTTANWPEEQKRFMDGLENLKAKKIIRAHGVSVHTMDALKAAANNPWVDVCHVRINPFGASMDSKNYQDVIPFVKQMHDAGKGIIGMKLIGNGSFRDDSAKIDQSLKFVLGLGSVDMIIVGFEKPEQIDNYILRVQNLVL